MKYPVQKTHKRLFIAQERLKSGVVERVDVGPLLDFFVGSLYSEILRGSDGELGADFVVCIIHIYDRVRPVKRQGGKALHCIRRFFEAKYA